MAIFAKLSHEEIVQVDDKTRLDALESFVTNEASAITLVRIKPESSESFITASNNFIDWAYTTDGIKTITLEVTTDGAPVTKDFTLNVLSVADDNLFSSDAEIVQLEDNILTYTRKGRSSFLDKHREAQNRIMAELDERGITDLSGDRLTKSAIVDVQETKEWSKYLCLQLIFESISNAIDDIFQIKADRYKDVVNKVKERAILRLDRDGDASISNSEKYDMKISRLRLR